MFVGKKQFALAKVKQNVESPVGSESCEYCEAKTECYSMKNETILCRGKIFEIGNEYQSTFFILVKDES